jgi:energy-coupling factor transport system ATP-binding protein
VPKSSILEIKNVTYTYPTRRHPTIEDVNLNLRSGECVLLLGPTGSGKSTLAMCLNGLIPHSLGGQLEGRVLVDGVDTRQSSVTELATQVGLLFQDPEAQICNLYALDELAFGCENLGLPPDEIQKRVNWVADALEISSFLTTPVQHLSLGLKQRIALGSILAMEPRVLVLDEPTSNLDAGAVRTLVRIIDTLRNKQGSSVLVMEHDADSFLGVADRVVVLNKGKLVTQGSPKQVFLGQTQNLLDMGVKVPELCYLLDGIRQLGVSEVYNSDICVSSVSQFIASQCRSVWRQGIQHTESNHPQTKRVPNLAVSELDIQMPDGHMLLNDINFSLFPRETVAVIGRNGVGKTVLFKTIAGLRTPTRGNIEINGTNILQMKSLERAKRIGFVFQEPDHQFIRDRVCDDIELVWRSICSSPVETIRKANETLAHISLTDYRESYIYQLSMGQRRLLSIATALTPGKTLLILDEPTIGLDSRATFAIIDMLNNIQGEALSKIVITHDMKIVSSLSQRVIALANSQIAYNGPLFGLYEQPQVMNTIGISPSNAWEVYKTLRSSWGMNINPAATVQELISQLERRGI